MGKIDPLEIPGLITQAFKLKDAVVDVVVKAKGLPSPLTGTALCGVFGIPAGTPLYTLAETVDLVTKDLST